MVGFQQFGIRESKWVLALLDAVLLAVIVAPIAYFFFIRPRDRHIRAVMRDLEQARQDAEDVARLDALTGILARRALFEALDNEIERSKRYGGNLACLMLDLDHFKTFNDNFGHQFGDEVLRRTARVISEHCRANDIPGRYGGEEFLIVLPATGIDGATAFAERVRLAIAATPLDLGEERITVSIGVAEWRESYESSSKLIAEADKALFEAKATGRNVVVASKPG
jgi:diguanylate cyclase (GGDEF)-like protein